MQNDSGRAAVPADAYLSLLATMAFFGSAFASSKVVVEQLPHQVAALSRTAESAGGDVDLRLYGRSAVPGAGAGGGYVAGAVVGA